MADGVLIAEVDERSLVCFVELKSTLKPTEDKDRVARALHQLDSATTHFHPSERSGATRSHGDEHHDAWAAGQDVLPVMPVRNHEVIAVAVTFRQLPRRAPERPLTVGNTTVYRAVLQVSPAVMNRAETSLRKLLTMAGRGS